jgi:hypothetical protein
LERNPKVSSGSGDGFPATFTVMCKRPRLVVWTMSFSGNRTGAREEEEWVGGRELVKKEVKCLFGV